MNGGDYVNDNTDMAKQMAQVQNKSITSQYKSWLLKSGSRDLFESVKFILVAQTYIASD